MQVTESIDVENVDKAGSKQKVLRERRKHVPNVKLDALSDSAKMSKRWHIREGLRQSSRHLRFYLDQQKEQR